MTTPYARQFLNRLSVIEADSRKVIESQESTLRKLSGLRADFQQWIEDEESKSAPKVATAGMVEAPVYTVQMNTRV